MAYRKLEIGDRVIVTETYGRAEVGMTGTICYFRDELFDQRGVRYDSSFKGGHDLDRHCDRGYGWFTPEGCLELLEEDQEPEIEQEDILSFIMQ